MTLEELKQLRLKRKAQEVENMEGIQIIPTDPIPTAEQDSQGFDVDLEEIMKELRGPQEAKQEDNKEEKKNRRRKQKEGEEGEKETGESKKSK